MFADATLLSAILAEGVPGLVPAALAGTEEVVANLFGTAVCRALGWVSGFLAANRNDPGSPSKGISSMYSLPYCLMSCSPLARLSAFWSMAADWAGVIVSENSRVSSVTPGTGVVDLLWFVDRARRAASSVLDTVGVYVCPWEAEKSGRDDVAEKALVSDVTVES